MFVQDLSQPFERVMTCSVSELLLWLPAALPGARIEIDAAAKHCEHGSTAASSRCAGQCCPSAGLAPCVCRNCICTFPIKDWAAMRARAFNKPLIAPRSVAAADHLAC